MAVEFDVFDSYSMAFIGTVTGTDSTSALRKAKKQFKQCAPAVAERR